MVKKKIYYGIDWLRAFACIGIALMHIRANSNYHILGNFYNVFIPSLTNFVYLFMAISAFVMCLGYFDKVMNGSINWTDFYKKRYTRILPFFAILVILDVFSSFNINSLLEGITELTLLHGFIPQELSVIGVGWYLGTVFVFYLIFPFFCVLIENKKRAWISFIIFLILHYVCVYQFSLNRHNIIFSLCYFLAGGLVYLYRKDLSKICFRYYIILFLFVSIIYYLFYKNDLVLIILVVLLLSAAIAVDIGESKFISFISGLSMEIYLSHMMLFRVCEKLHINTFFGDGLIQYIFTSSFVIFGCIIFSFLTKRLIKKIERDLLKYR